MNTKQYSSIQAVARSLTGREAVARLSRAVLPAQR